MFYLLKLADSLSHSLFYLFIYLFNSLIQMDNIHLLYKYNNPNRLNQYMFDKLNKTIIMMILIFILITAKMMII